MVFFSYNHFYFTLNLVAPLVKSSTLSETDQTKTVMADSPVTLQCELSDTGQEASWYTDETELLPQTGADLQSKGTLHRIYLQSEGNVQTVAAPPTQQTRIGTCHCELKDDEIQFAAEVKGDSQQLCNTFDVLLGQLTTVGVSVAT